MRQSMGFEPELPIDRWLLGATLILLSFGALMVYSTTAVQAQHSQGNSLAMFRTHIIHILIGILSLFVAIRIKLSHLHRYSWLLFGLVIILLTLTLMPGIGVVAGGARRWLALGPIRFQPGEIAKLGVIIFFSSYIARKYERMGRFGVGVILPFVLLGAVSILLLAEPDFGSTAIIVLVVFSQLAMVCRVQHLILTGAGACVSLGLLVYLSPYRFKRFTTFLDPFNDPTAAGYQLIQSLIAVGSGGLSGTGLGAGKQKLYYLPAAHTDFIYAVIAEELGIIGALSVLALFLIILHRGLLIVRRHLDRPFISSLSLGCTLLIVVPAMLNIAVVTGLLPTKGLVLPLVAYGGTAIVVNLTAIGLLLNISRYQSRS